MSGVFRGRDLCRASLAWRGDRGLRPGYAASGRFVEPPAGQYRIFRPEHLIVAHYAALEGALYADAAAWETAFRLVRGFTAGGAFRGRGAGFPAGAALAPLGDVDPPAALRSAVSAFTRCGFRCVDTSEIQRSAAFELTDACKVMDLPEPYGKWLVRRDGRPQWKNPVELRVTARCALEAGRGGISLAIEVSAPAPPLVPVLAREIEAGLHLDEGWAAGARARLERIVKTSLRDRLAPVEA